MCQETILEYNLSQDIIQFPLFYVNPKSLIFSDESVIMSIQDLPSLLLDKVILNKNKASFFHSIRTYDSETLQCAQLQTETIIQAHENIDDKIDKVLSIQHNVSNISSNIIIVSAHPNLTSWYSSFMLMLSKVKITESPLHKIFVFKNEVSNVNLYECVNILVCTNESTLHHINIQTQNVNTQNNINVLANISDSDTTRTVIQATDCNYTITCSKIKNNINYIYDNFGYKSIVSLYGHIASYTHILFILLTHILTNDSIAAILSIYTMSCVIIFLPTLLLLLFKLINRLLSKYKTITNDNYGLVLRIINQGEFIWEILSIIYIITSMINYINVIELKCNLPIFNIPLNDIETTVIFPTKYGCLTPAKILLVMSITVMSEVIEYCFYRKTANIVSYHLQNRSMRIYLALLIQYIITNRILGHILLFIFISIVNQIILMKQRHKNMNATPKEN